MQGTAQMSLSSLQNHSIWDFKDLSEQITNNTQIT